MIETIDINCDMGESFGNYKLGNDEAIMPYISSCNIACGFHAGDPLVISRTMEHAIRTKVAIGAHPSYPDLQGFGRRSMQLSAPELEAFIIYQVSAILGMAKALGGKVSHVKPHGALYTDMASSEHISEIFVRSVIKTDPALSITGLAGSATESVAKEAGVEFRAEFFADRNYDNEGRLVSRKAENAVLESPQIIAQRVLNFLTSGKIKSVHEEMVTINARTICIHGDHAQSLAIAKAIHTTLDEAGIRISYT